MGLLSLLGRSRLTPAALGIPLPKRLDGAEALERFAAELAQVPVDWRQLAPLFCFDPEQYGRRVLFRSWRWEMVLACWLPNQGSPMHGHGRSMGAARVLLGSVRETRFVKERGELRVEAAHRFEQGEVMLERRGEIHRLDNPANLPAVTLHIYSPPLAKMRAIYDTPLEPQASGPSLTPQPLQLVRGAGE